MPKLKYNSSHAFNKTYNFGIEPVIYIDTDIISFYNSLNLKINFIV